MNEIETVNGLAGAAAKLAAGRARTARLPAVLSSPRSPAAVLQPLCWVLPSELLMMRA